MGFLHLVFAVSALSGIADAGSHITGTIVETAAANGSFNTLAAALGVTNLVDTLNGAGSVWLPACPRPPRPSVSPFVRLSVCLSEDPSLFSLLRMPLSGLCWPNWASHQSRHSSERTSPLDELTQVARQTGIPRQSDT